MTSPPAKLVEAFSGKTALVTGHTGFKGSWLSVWLQRLGARVVGLSVDVPTRPSHFEALGLASAIVDRRLDVRNAADVASVIAQVRPDFLFHLAAQPLVRRSYRSPFETFATNTLGTASVLEALRQSGTPCVAVMITSDKCYDNVEWVWGYRETDRLGGKDPYSGSKGAAELVIRSYFASYFADATSAVRIASVRAGNVIGGGDWAEDRIVPDCVRSWADGRAVEVRNPDATRPWQHVLEPLSGYLWLATRLKADRKLNGEAFNFGPNDSEKKTVKDVIDALAHTWSGKAAHTAVPSGSDAAEAGLLQLNCDKAFARLGWHPTLAFAETMAMTGKWYDAYYSAPQSASVAALTTSQIETYETLARERGLAWAC
jgi:CDP-glucose 4,6-dehydratase